MGRDLDELISGPNSGLFTTVFLVLFFSLPVAALLLLAARRWSAVVPLVGWLSLVIAWFLYYATDWIGPVDAGGGAAGFVFLLVLAGWVWLLIAAFAPWRDVPDSAPPVP